jgi:hypothetical protein
MAMNQPVVSRKPLPRTRQRARAAWIFCSILLGILALVVILDKDHLVGVSQPILAVFAGLLAGMMTFFLTGELGLQLRWLRGTGGVGVFALVLVFWTRLMPAPEPGLYRVRVTVLGAQGELIEEAVVRTSVGGEMKKVEGGWELDIPVGILPADHRLIIYAENPSSRAQKRQELTLSTDFQPTVEIKLLEDRNTMVHGRVLDEAGNPLSEARVSIIGHEAEAVLTGPSSEFILKAHAATGQMVRLRAEKKGFLPMEQDHPAGSGLATVVLERQ